jgi:mRNA degradation ribonuclease J1/J2
MALEIPNSPNWVDLTFLGGLGEIGLNLMTLETDGYLVVVDAGLMFPEDQMLGIDIVIPDFSQAAQKGQIDPAKVGGFRGHGESRGRSGPRWPGARRP